MAVVLKLLHILAHILRSRAHPEASGDEMTEVRGSSGLAVWTLLGCMGLPMQASADVSEVGWSLAIEGIKPSAVQLTLDAEVFSMVRGVWRVGVELPPKAPARLSADTGVLLIVDALAWVPEWYMGFGLSADRARWQPRFLSQLGLRRFISMEWSMGAYIGYVYDGGHGVLVGLKARFGE